MAHMATYLGCIYLAEVNDDGTLRGNWESPGEAFPLTIKLADETVTIKGRTCLTGGKTVGTKSRAGEASGSLTLHEYTVSNVAKALKGIISQKKVTVTTLNAKTIMLGKIGEWVEVGAEDLTSISVTDTASSPKALVSDVDYAINPVLGLISPLKGSVAETEIKISAESGADTGTRITIGAGATAKYALKGNLINEFSQEKVKVFLRKILLTSNNEINFVSEEGTDHEQIDFTLTPEIPTGKSDYGTIDGLPV